jgi:hypothetical protein
MQKIVREKSTEKMSRANIWLPHSLYFQCRKLALEKESSATKIMTDALKKYVEEETNKKMIVI